MQKNRNERESRKRKFGEKMSEDKGSVAVVNVVKPTFNQSTASRNLEEVDHTTSTNSIFLLPCRPPELLAALSKEIEPFDQFSEAFGTVNKYGETILFDLHVPVCKLDKNGSYDRVTLQSNGKVTIIFRPEQRRVFVIVKRDDIFWPTYKELLGTTKFNVDGWAVKLFDNNSEGLCSKTIHSDFGYIFEVQDSASVRFSNARDLVRFKNVIRNVQARIAKNRLPTNDYLPKRGVAFLVSRFWFLSALRPCDLKLLFVHSALIWRIKSSNPAISSCGYIAIAQYKVYKLLHLITITKDTKINCVLTEEFTLIASDISSDTNHFVWEWFVRHNNRIACGFKTAKEASEFKVTTDYYLNAWKQGSLSWDW